MTKLLTNCGLRGDEQEKLVPIFSFIWLPHQYLWAIIKGTASLTQY